MYCCNRCLCKGWISESDNSVCLLHYREILFWVLTYLKYDKCMSISLCFWVFSWNTCIVTTSKRAVKLLVPVTYCGIFAKFCNVSHYFIQVTVLSSDRYCLVAWSIPTAYFLDFELKSASFFMFSLNSGDWQVNFMCKTIHQLGSSCLLSHK